MRCRGSFWTCVPLLQVVQLIVVGPFAAKCCLVSCEALAQPGHDGNIHLSTTCIQCSVHSHAGCADTCAPVHEQQCGTAFVLRCRAFCSSSWCLRVVDSPQSVGGMLCNQPSQPAPPLRVPQCTDCVSLAGALPCWHRLIHRRMPSVSLLQPEPPRTPSASRTA